MEIPDARKYGESQLEKERALPPIFSEEPITFDFEDLREPSLRILEEIKEHIMQGSYRMVIGDDASGRIPTLLLSGVIKNACQTAGKESPAVRFFAGDRFNKNEAFATELANRFAREFTELASTHGARVLVVTDTINTGAALRPLVAQLARYQIPYDIASIGYLAPYANSDAKRERTKADTLSSLGDHVYVGADGVPGSVYQNPHASGVVRQAGVPVAKPVVGTVPPYFGQLVTQEHINASRKSIEALAREVTQQFLASANTTT